MNRKGFTLVEVILVIAIMALLLLVLVPNIFVLLDKNKEKSCDSLVNNIESAAKIYVSLNKYDLGFGCAAPYNTKDIKLETLVESGDLTLDSSGILKNPIDDTKIELTNTVTVTYSCDTKQFTYQVNGIDCTKE